MHYFLLSQNSYTTSLISYNYISTFLRDILVRIPYTYCTYMCEQAAPAWEWVRVCRRSCAQSTARRTSSIRWSGRTKWAKCVCRTATRCSHWRTCCAARRSTRARRPEWLRTRRATRCSSSRTSCCTRCASGCSPPRRHVRARERCTHRAAHRPAAERALE